MSVEELLGCSPNGGADLVAHMADSEQGLVASYVAHEQSFTSSNSFRAVKYQTVGERTTYLLFDGDRGRGTFEVSYTRAGTYGGGTTGTCTN
ncbi:MAG: hypothetical protein WA988_09710 [Candidatus Nanopelagicales bacterium]